MNRYATTAMAYFRDYLPTRYAELDDPAEYFRDLGEQIQDRVVDLAPQLAGPDRPGEGFLAKTGRLNAARAQAEELVLSELLYSQKPEHEEQDLDPEAAAYYGDVNRTIQELHDAMKHALDDPEPIGRSSERE
ncbi:hypothetical protein [Kribbella shirazensis]|uniref:TnpV protein n=1 Tax=Kribbella shirazensis TaxID=1105143 RepID=A0A7X5V475_9ACTN|nr:hypothetical protein [Kribbella shirazensis]NIK54310.1 hypothetical protein [Kribbella shirazensis]